MRYSKCVKCSRTVGWVGLATNTVLMFMKGFVGMVSGSQALVADAMYSAKDVITSLLVIVGMNVSERPLDKDHPYGHGKIEFILSLFVSVLFIIVTGYLFVHAVTTLFNSRAHSAPHLIALWAALVSVAVNVGMYFYSRCVSVETNSPIVKTLSKHHHADASASGMVALGIIGAHYLNMPWIDTAVAVLETIHLMYLGGDVFMDATKGLMDKSLGKNAHKRLAHYVRGVEGVKELKRIRTRHVGQEVSVEIVIGVDAEMSVAESFELTELVKDMIYDEIPHIGLLQVTAEAHEEDAEALEDIREQWKKSMAGQEMETEGA
ncbi:MAG: magnetosome biogenesis CDF transporter MamM [Alphaproteobacteria bacterium]|nr:magnetosome biogenesis CDF transporter MamM [Alphaproteobacteria bacterium]MBF0250895.1 magnetosome biogenesis CDF transporter MamM [Alphaproteobacteria bacterium]